MCEANTGSAREDSCAHRRTVDDFNTGDTVCIDCGLCLDAVYAPNYAHYMQSHPMHNSAHSPIREFITDVCEHAGLPNNLIDYTIWVYKSMLPQLAKTKYCYARNGNAVAAFALYESAIRHQTPLTSQEISFYSGISTAELWGIERALHDNTNDAPPSQYVERYCQWIGIHYFPHQSIIKTISDNMFGMRNSRSSCIVATVMFLYSKEHNLNHTLKLICETCGVSASCVQKLIKTLDDKYVRNISLLA